MSYESLADGGFETGTMLGSGGFIVMDETTCIVKNLLTFAGSTTTNPVDNAVRAAKEPDGWKKYCSELKMAAER